MQLNQTGLQLIKRYESLRLRAYKDGVGIWTIGWGHTRNVGSGMVCTLEEAEEWLQEDLQGPMYALRGYAATENQFAAMVCLAYNIGTGNFHQSSVWKYHKNKQYLNAANAFLLWGNIRIDGKLVPSTGLMNRRHAERTLYMRPDNGN